MSGMNTWWEHESKMKPSGAEMGSATLPMVKGLGWDPPECCEKSCTSVPHLPLLLFWSQGSDRHSWERLDGGQEWQTGEDRARPGLLRNPPGSTRTCRQLSEVDRDGPGDGNSAFGAALPLQLFLSDCCSICPEQ